MAHAFAQAVELVTTALAVAGMGYFFAAMMAAFVFLAKRRPAVAGFAPGVTILKSLKGLDPAMLDAFRSHCRQDYAGEYELLFGVAAADDPAVSAVVELQREFPERAIRLIVCPERLGTNGKVSTLAQLIPQARYDYLLINDSDITVSPRYLTRVMGELQGVGSREQGIERLGPREQGNKGTRPVGLVTALYRGRPDGSLWSKLEALGIATDFQPSVLLARWIEGGLRYGLGSTLAVRREALTAIGGIETLVDHLADDYELGARIYKAGFAIALCHEVVETSVPDYSRRGFFEHQVRWYRTVRDARPGGYVGLVFTMGLGWALLNVVASGVSLLSVWLLALSFFLRLALAMAVAANVLGDHDVLPNLWLLPLRDVVAMGTWVAGFAGNTIVWRGERFELKDGKLSAVGAGLVLSHPEHKNRV
jgi:ceramide glucosyltransferase